MHCTWTHTKALLPLPVLSEALPLEASEESGLNGSATGSYWHRVVERPTQAQAEPHAARWEAASWEVARSAA